MSGRKKTMAVALVLTKMSIFRRMTIRYRFAARLVVSLVLMIAGIYTPCVTLHAFSVDTPLSRNIATAVTQHDMIIAPNGENVIRLTARRSFRQQLKVFYGLLIAVVQQRYASFVERIFITSVSLEKNNKNKFLTVLQFLQTLF